MKINIIGVFEEEMRLSTASLIEVLRVDFGLFRDQKLNCIVVLTLRRKGENVWLEMRCNFLLP